MKTTMTTMDDDDDLDGMLAEAISAAHVEMVDESSDDIRLQIITWNVGNKEPDADELKHLFEGSPADTLDVIVIGAQECSY